MQNVKENGQKLLKLELVEDRKLSPILFREKMI